MRSHSATPLRPTCLSRAARSRRNEASSGLILMRSLRHDMASYQNPRTAFLFTLGRSQLKSTSISTRHVLNSQRSIMPPATISCDGESGLRIAEMYQRYCTSGSSVRPKSLRSRDWTPACAGVGIGPSCSGLTVRVSMSVNRMGKDVGLERNQFKEDAYFTIRPTWSKTRTTISGSFPSVPRKLPPTRARGTVLFLSRGV